MAHRRRAAACCVVLLSLSCRIDPAAPEGVVVARHAEGTVSREELDDWIAFSGVQEDSAGLERQIEDMLIIRELAGSAEARGAESLPQMMTALRVS